jgi:hypothetical protein
MSKAGDADVAFEPERSPRGQIGIGKPYGQLVGAPLGVQPVARVGHRGRDDHHDPLAPARGIVLRPGANRRNQTATGLQPG